MRYSTLFHSNSKYLIAIGLSAALISGCACRGNGRLADGLRLLGTHDCQKCNQVVPTQVAGFDYEHSSQCDCDACAQLPQNRLVSKITGPGKEKNENNALNRIDQNINYEIRDNAADSSTLPNGEAEEPISHDEANYFSGLSQERSSRSNNQSLARSTQDHETRTSKIIVSEELYTTSLKSRESIKQMDVGVDKFASSAANSILGGLDKGNSLSLSALDAETELQSQPITKTKPADLTPELQLELAVESVASPSLNQSRNKAGAEAKPAAKPTKTTQSNKHDSTPESIKDNSNIELQLADQPATSTAKAVMSVPRNSDKRKLEQRLVDEAPATSMEEQPLVLQADPASNRNFLDSLANRPIERERQQRLKLQKPEDASSWIVESVNFRPLPGAQAFSGQVIPVADEIDFQSTTNSDKMTPLQVSKFQRERVPATRLPVSSSLPLMMQASVSKRSWESAPQMDSHARARLLQQAQQQQLRESQPQGNSANDVGNYPSTGAGHITAQQNSNHNLVLRATTNQANEWIPPRVSINTEHAITSNADCNQLPSDNAERLEVLHQRLRYGNLPAYDFGPAVDGEVSDSIRRLTVRPAGETRDSNTIDR